MFNQATHKVEEVGRFLLSREKRDTLSAGEVGYIFAGVKTVSTSISAIRFTLDDRPCDKALPGFQGIQTRGLFLNLPHRPEDYEDLAVALEKYKLK